MPDTLAEQQSTNKILKGLAFANHKKKNRLCASNNFNFIPSSVLLSP